MEGFCGKDCALCAQAEELGCPGCREGLGRAFSGPCEIAACCREKGHEACGTCVHQSGCGRWAGRDQVPGKELRRREEERARRETLAEQAPVLAKWLGRMFWLTVPQVLAGVLSMEKVSEWFPALGTAGRILSALCCLAMALFLWKLGPVLEDYRKAALLHLSLAAASVLVEVLRGEALGLVLSLAVIALGLCRDYLTYHAHAQVLAGVEEALADSCGRSGRSAAWGPIFC